MSSWQEALKELQGEFVRGSLQRIDKMRGLLRALGASPGDSELRHDLRVQFHGLAGSGSTYGLPEVTRLGLLGERLLLEADGGPPDANLLASLGALVGELREALVPGDAAPAPEADAPAQSARILCVEDFEEQAVYLKAVLGSAGYVVEVVSDPRAFEAALAEFRPDLVLMDILLPGTSGYELTRLVRSRPSFASLPVLLMTTDAQPDARALGRQAGGDDHLVKPIAPALLLTTVETHLERARAGRKERVRG